MDAPAKVLILFIDGEDASTVESAQKVAKMMGEQCVLQVVDVNEDTDLAEVVGVDSTPTLVRLSPDPRRKVAGDLTNHEEVAGYLGAAWTPRT
jgi:circadian clock protein KaiB